MVAPVHRFLHQRRPGSPGSQSIWVLHGPGVADIFYHDLFNGCVDLRKTVELWALDEWRGGERQGRPITVTLTGSGALDFSGNPDPLAAQELFDRMRNPRAPRYGRRRQARDESAAPESSGEPADNAETATEHAAQGVRATLGDGQGLVNRMNQIAAAMESESGERILVVVERFAEQLVELEALGQPAVVLQAQKVLHERWLRKLDHRNAMLVFLAFDRRALQQHVTLDHRGVQWWDIQGPKGEEISEALVRLSRRCRFELEDPAAVGANLEHYGSLRIALGNPARVVRSGSPVKVETVMDLPPVNEAEVARILAELDGLIGLEEVKQKARDLAHTARARRRRLEEDGRFPDETMHLIFSGEPGTGKTTVARIIARLYHALGILPSDRVMEVKASEGIMSPTVGQTETNMQLALEGAIGGVMFIDEAHSFGDSDDFRAREAIQALVPMAWNNRNQLVIIMAGYTDKMPDVLAMDQGLPRRFPTYGRVEFVNYTSSELWQILRGKLARDGWALDEDAEAALRVLLRRRASRAGFSNAGGVELLVSEVVQIHDRRSGSQFGVLNAQDLPPTLVRHPKQIAEAERVLGSMVGLGHVRETIQTVVDGIAFDLEEGDGELRTDNMLFVGPPGTGKTTVARLMANMLYGVGALASNAFVEVGGASLKAPYMGQTTAKVSRAVQDARDGVLFVDEAYGIVSGDGDHFGSEALTELMRQVTLPDNVGTVFILAGYERDLHTLLQQNPGMNRRFSKVVRFENFTPDDCVELARRRLTEKNFTWGSGFLEALRTAASRAIEQQLEGFGNAGWALDAVDRACEKLKRRVQTACIPLEGTVRRMVVVADLEAAMGMPLTSAQAQPSVDSQVSRHEASRPRRSEDRLRVIDWSAPKGGAALPVRSDTLTDSSRAAVQMVDAAVHLVVDLGDERHLGTGFMVTQDGLLATNAHVIRGATKVEALLGPDRGSVTAEVVMSDERLDLALLAVHVPGEVPKLALPLGRSDCLRPLQSLIVLGNAQVQPGEPPRVVEAKVARNNELDSHYFETDGAIEPGFSGGPVLDPEQGAVVGVVVAGRGETVRMMIRIEHVRRMLEQVGYQFEEETQRG